MAKTKNLTNIIIVIILVAIAIFLLGREIFNVASHVEEKELSILTTQAHIDSVDIQQSIDKYSQAKVVARGNLEYDCSTVGTPQVEKGNDNVFKVVIQEERPKNSECNKRDRNFSTAFSLDLAGLPPDTTYILDVNKLKTSFEVLESGTINILLN